MKKLTAMLLSLMMCFSLMAIPVQAALIPIPDGPGVINVGGLKDPVDPGDDDRDAPVNPVQPMKFPEPVEDMPTD